MSVDLSAYFSQFLENISLGDPQVPRMSRAAETVVGFLRTSYGLPAANFFLQGSFPNGTSVEPVDGGEYDVDVVAVCVGGDTTSTAALADLQWRFESDGRFAPRVKSKKPCIRLEYAEDEVGKFHVDVVPVRVSSANDCPFDAPRRDEGWHGTAPAEYTQWCVAQGDSYVRIVKYMKRWRDEQQSVRTAVKSIVLQVLVSQCMSAEASDADCLAGTLRNLHVHLSGLTSPPAVPNPVLLRENFAERWTPESFHNFVSELAEAVEWADRATSSSDEVEAADAWRELLGDDFPVLGANQLGFQIGDTSHADTPAAMGWTETLDARYRATVLATVQRGRRGQNRRPYRSGGPVIFAGHKLHFTAQMVAPNHVEVWWQVANTGGHAREASCLRGQIFRGHDLQHQPTRNQAENWEDTAYTGTHLIRTLLVRNNTVVATSEWFAVNVYSRGNRFRP